jgi:hypothetical protein
MRLHDLHPMFARVWLDLDRTGWKFDDDGHVHPLVSYPPRSAVAKPLNSCREYRIPCIRKKTAPALQGRNGRHLWSPGDAAGGCGGGAEGRYPQGHRTAASTRSDRPTKDGVAVGAIHPPP